MEGLGGWTYPYQRVLIDDAQGEILGLWKQIADVTRPDGSHYEIAGLGGSWFRYAGNFRWSWQRDFFDVGNATATFIEMINAGVLTPGMQKRLEKSASGKRQPGHYRVGQAPVDLWEGVSRPIGGHPRPKHWMTSVRHALISSELSESLRPMRTNTRSRSGQTSMYWPSWPAAQNVAP